MSAASMITRISDRFAGRHGDAGFTVLEVVVAMTIFVIVAVAAGGAVVSGIKASTTTTHQVAGANIAQSDLEQARAQATPSPTAYPTAASTGGATYQVSRSVIMPTPSGTESCPGGSEIRISVVVTGPGDEKRSVRMDTVIAC